MPSAVRATSTVSIVARISAPMASSVMPSVSSIARCPSAVAPPWLPIAGTTNGSAPSSRKPLMVPRSSATRSVEAAAAATDGHGHAGRHRCGQRSHNLTRVPSPRHRRRGRAGEGELDLGEVGHRQVGMKWQVDSVEQLFPRVHGVDANPTCGQPPQRGCTGNNGAVEPVDGVYRTPRGLRIAADAVSWIATCSGGPGGQHANTSDTAVTVTIDVERAELAAAVRERVVAAAGSTITASSSGSRSQFRNRATAWAAALDRLDEAAKPPPPPRTADTPFGVGHPQAVDQQTSRCRAQTGAPAPVERGISAARITLHLLAAAFRGPQPSRTCQSVLRRVHPITTQSEPVAHSVSIRYCAVVLPASATDEKQGSDHGHHTDAIRGRTTRPADQRQRHPGAKAPATPAEAGHPPRRAVDLVLVPTAHRQSDCDRHALAHSRQSRAHDARPHAGDDHRDDDDPAADVG